MSFIGLVLTIALIFWPLTGHEALSVGKIFMPVVVGTILDLIVVFGVCIMFAFQKKRSDDDSNR